MDSRESCAICSQIAGDFSNDILGEVLGSTRRDTASRVDYAEGVVFPSIGALAPGHLLLCPRGHVPSVVMLDDDTRRLFLQLLDQVRRKLAARAGHPVHCFEHGMARHGSRPVCTVAHAHVHLLPSSADPAIVLRDGNWVRVPAGSSDFAEYMGDFEYLLYISPTGEFWTQRGAEGSFRSQALRQTFAEAHGIPEQWNWREFARADTVRQSLEMARSLA